MIESEALEGAPPPVSSPSRMALARALLARRSSRIARLRGLEAALSRGGIPASLVEQDLEAFLRAGWITLVEVLRGTRRSISQARLVDLDALEELVRPGEREARRIALEAAETVLATRNHPVSEDARRFLATAEAGRAKPQLVRALVEVVRHAELGDVLPERVFAARYLGNSKALVPLRQRLERILGPLADLGIREGSSAVFVGGSGRFRSRGLDVDLEQAGLFVGLSREIVLGAPTIEWPPEGLFLVENFTVFEACCRAEVPDAGATLLAWTGGYPGRGVHSLVASAASVGVPIRVWADLDLAGVRIVRLVTSWAPGSVEAFGMAPEALREAPIRVSLSDRATAALRADLEAHPTALLADTLRALLDERSTVEQEVFLGRPTRRR